MALSIFFFAQEKSHPPKSPLRNEQKRVYKGEIKVYHFGKKRGENRIGAGQNRNSHFDSSVQNFPRTKKKAATRNYRSASAESTVQEQHGTEEEDTRVYGSRAIGAVNAFRVLFRVFHAIWERLGAAVY
ncbi:hypothetical protein KY289_035622 [Solanum tuberosum]|nr:hypothetical protein KY289_035622 [Solanum tuberosum]